MDREEIDVNAQERDSKNSAVHYAVANCEASILRDVFQSTKIDIDLMNSNNDTPINIAASHGCAEGVELLLKR